MSPEKPSKWAAYKARVKEEFKRIDQEAAQDKAKLNQEIAELEREMAEIKEDIEQLNKESDASGKSTTTFDVLMYLTAIPPLGIILLWLHHGWGKGVGIILLKIFLTFYAILMTFLIIQVGSRIGSNLIFFS